MTGRSIESDDPEAYIESQYVPLTADSGNLRANFYNPLSSSTAQMQTNITTRASEVAANLPPVTVEEEAAYINDLSRRQEANYWLAYYDIFTRSDLLFEVQAKRQDMDEDALREFFIFLSEASLKLGMYRLVGHFGDAAADAFLMAYHAYINNELIEQDQQYRDMAVGLMHHSYETQTFLASNTLSALSIVESASDPQTPAGEIVSVDLVKTKLGFPLNFVTQDIFADIEIQNNGDVTANYAIIAYYAVKVNPGSFRQFNSNIVDPITDETLGWLTLSPGGQDTARLYFKQANGDDMGTPKYGVYFALYAFSENGIYLLDMETLAPFEPVTQTAAPTSQTATVTPALPTNIDMPMAGLSLGSTISETERYPIWASVSAPVDQITYTMNIAADNPFPMSIPVIITQTIPSGVTVIDADEGVVTDDEIAWYRIIQPRQTILLRYDFAYSGGFTTEATLPPMTLNYYDAVDDVNIALSSGDILFYAKSPLLAEATASLNVPPGSQQTVSVDVTNMDSSMQQGILTLHVWDLNGTDVVSDTANISLSGSANQSYNLTYTAPVEDLYVLEVDLAYGTETSSVLSNILNVRMSRIYLPAILK